MSAEKLGFCCNLDEDGVGQVVVTRVIQESPAAYSGQVGIGDVIEAIDDRMISSLEQLNAAADGLVDTLVAIELRRKGCSHLESLHLMRQAPHDASDSTSSSGENAGLGARVVHDERGMRVCDLYEGSSSYWSTLKIDDIVCAVDAQDIRHGPPSLVLQLTNGPIGTSMCLHVIRKESSDDEIAGALSARGLGERHHSSMIHWKDSKEPKLGVNEKLTRVLVVRSRPLANSALTRAMAYRARVVDLLQTRIEVLLVLSLFRIRSNNANLGEQRALLEGNSTDAETERRVSDETLQSVSHEDETRVDESLALKKTQARGSTSVRMDEPGNNSDVASSGLTKTPRTTILEMQLMALQERHEKEMRKLQDQIAGLASVIKPGEGKGRGDSKNESQKTQARDVQESLLECVEKLSIQQQEEKKNTIALFQRHCQETMASHERLTADLHREVQELRKKEYETEDFKQRFDILVQKVEELNLNNVLLGNIPGQVRALTKPLPALKAPLDNQRGVTVRNLAVQNTGIKSSNVVVPALSISQVHAKNNTKSFVGDKPVGVSITIGADFNRVQKHEKRFSDDLVSACAWCLQASEDRFVYCHIERGSVVAKLNIVPDPSGMDPRPCRRLAEELAAQAMHPHSPMRKAPVTKPATMVVIHSPISPGGSSNSISILPPLGEVEVADSPREELSEVELEESPRRGPDKETWSGEQKQESYSTMKQRLEEMTSVVSNLARESQHLAVSSSAGVRNQEEEESSHSSDETEKEEVSYSFPPKTSPLSKSPVKTTPVKSIMDLSLDLPFTGITFENDQKPPHPRQHLDKSRSARTPSRKGDANYRRLPASLQSSTIELESVLGRLEHSQAHTPGQKLPQSHLVQSQLKSNSLSRQYRSRLDDSRISSRTYVPRANEFATSYDRDASPGESMMNHYMSERGVLTPGSDISVNESSPSPPHTEPKKWRVLPQWSQGKEENSSTVKGTQSQRQELVLGTPRSQSSAVPSARISMEPQTLRSQEQAQPNQEAPTGITPRTSILSLNTRRSLRSARSPERLHQNARSEESTEVSDGDARQNAKHSARSTPASSISGDGEKQAGHLINSKAQSIVESSDSDEEVRVRAGDLPVRRFHQRFQK